jgi:hypothetical protein
MVDFLDSENLVKNKSACPGGMTAIAPVKQKKQMILAGKQLSRAQRSLKHRSRLLPERACVATVLHVPMCIAVRGCDVAALHERCYVLCH